MKMWLSRGLTSLTFPNESRAPEGRSVGNDARYGSEKPVNDALKERQHTRIEP